MGLVLVAEISRGRTVVWVRELSHRVFKSAEG